MCLNGMIVVVEIRRCFREGEREEGSAVVLPLFSQYWRTRSFYALE